MGLFSKNTRSLEDTVEDARGMGLRATRGASDVVSSTAESLRGLIDELESTLRGVRASDAENLGDSLRGKLDTVLSRLNGAGGTLSRRASTVRSQADDVVHDSPWQSIGVIAGAALLIGFLVGRS